MAAYGRYQVAEPHAALLQLHVPSGRRLREVDHEPKLAALDQQDLLTQGIYVDQFVAGAVRVDALGSCTANAAVAALSNVLAPNDFVGFVQKLGKTYPTFRNVYTDAVQGERAAIGFYHACTDQTGDTSSEWPPTDCGSSGPFVYSELQTLGVISGQHVGAANTLPSLMQSDGVLMGSPFFYAWEEPDAGGFVDGDGTPADLQRAIDSGVAGGHETYLCAVEKLAYFRGEVDPLKTVLRVRNSWGGAWGDHGCFRIHLSTLIALGQYCDFRQLVR